MRIVSLVPSATETLYELGLEDQIVAITRYCIRPADRVKLKPKVGGTKNPTVSEILELKPDIVIMDVDENRKADADELRKHGIELFVTFPKTMNDSVRMIEQMGETFHARDAAHKICDDIVRQIPKYSPSVRRKTLVLIWKGPYMTINSDTYVHDVCSFFGFDNVFATSKERYPKLTDDQIRGAAPEMVLFPNDPYPFRPRDVVQFLEKFPETPRTLLFDGTLITWHGYGTLRALRELPEIFAPLW